MDSRFLITGADDAGTTILLAHGAGAPMDSKSMNAVSAALADAGFRVARFEFGYMSARRTSGQRRPPPKAETLQSEYRDAVEALNCQGRLIIGGKSMGGRVASMVADDLFAAGQIAGLLCLGYPFHPPEKPAQLRTAHLEGLRTPTLIVQGTRDPFGGPDEIKEAIADAATPPPIEILPVEGGDHSFAVLKSSGRDQNLVHAEILDAVVDWIKKRF